MARDQNGTTIRLSGSDWLRLLGFLVLQTGAAFGLDTKQDRRLTVVETTQTILVQSVNGRLQRDFKDLANRVRDLEKQ